MANSDFDPLSLYLHIPFCSSKCGYCDFNSYEGLDHLVPEYTPALLSEIELWSAAAKSYALRTIFFGGGTPSLTDLEDIKEILRSVHANYQLMETVECSLEANPTELTLEHLTGLRELGINRLSMGVQSMNEEELLLLERDHSPERVLDAVADARAAGFDNINLDLMFGLPDQTLETWQQSVRTIVSLGTEHLSCYALTVEPGTALYYQVQKGFTPEPDPDMAAEQYEWTQDYLKENGYVQYEISNWSKPGKECQHNIVYWNAAPYLGIGAGAHSFFAGQRFGNTDAPNRYIEQVMETKLERDNKGRATMRQIAGGETPDRETLISDAIILGLRLLQGINEDEFETRHGVRPSAYFAKQFSKHADNGLIELEENSVKLSARGLLLSNEVFIDLIPDREVVS